MVFLAIWTIFEWSQIGSYIMKLFGYKIFLLLWLTLAGQNRGPYVYPKRSVLGESFKIRCVHVWSVFKYVRIARGGQFRSR